MLTPDARQRIPPDWHHMYERVWDEADYVVPPAENGAFFVMTNVVSVSNLKSYFSHRPVRLLLSESRKERNKGESHSSLRKLWGERGFDKDILLRQILMDNPGGPGPVALAWKETRERKNSSHARSRKKEGKLKKGWIFPIEGRPVLRGAYCKHA